MKSKEKKITIKIRACAEEDVVIATVKIDFKPTHYISLLCMKPCKVMMVSIGYQREYYNENGDCWHITPPEVPGCSGDYVVPIEMFEKFKEIEDDSQMG